MSSLGMRLDMSNRYLSSEEKFHKNYVVSDTSFNGSPCWEWTGNKDSYGYGRISHNYIYLKAHRVAYELLVGPLIADVTIDHLCRNQACVNPAHMEEVSFSENVKRSVPYRQPRRCCKHGHEFTEANTRTVIRKSGRLDRCCKECDKLRARSYRRKHKLNKDI